MVNLHRDVAALAEEWRTFKRALAVHMAMEDDFMFALLDGDGPIV